MAADPQLSVEQARETLRGAALRCTSCRVAVLQYLATATRPLSHSDVAADLVPHGYDKSTIYRCLVELAESGILARLDLGDHIWRFEVRGRPDEKSGDHPHFLCVDCGKVSCLPEVHVRLSPAKRGQPVAPGEVTEVLLKGHCVDCQ